MIIGQVYEWHERNAVKRHIIYVSSNWFGVGEYDADGPSSEHKYRVRPFIDL